ncbi:MAG: PspC domain-containing protein, partial [Anaerolineae bacterium]|nr:PspC domain-containing protein [Anaerolineae bacterium]
GEYFEIDPALVRLLFALIFFGYGAGLMVYVLLWIIMPSEDMLEVRKNKTENIQDSNEVVADLTPDEVVEKEEEK